MSAHTSNLATEIYNRFTNNDFDGVLALATDDWVGVAHHVGMTFNGKEGFLQFMQGFKATFPDCTIILKNQVITPDQVVNEFDWTGTHTGPLMTPSGAVPPTGKMVRSAACEVWGIRDGKLASIQNYQDGTTILAQLGLLPQPGPQGL